MNERGGMTMAGFYILSQYRGIIRDCSGVLGVWCALEEKES